MGLPKCSDGLSRRSGSHRTFRCGTNRNVATARCLPVTLCGTNTQTNIDVRLVTRYVRCGATWDASRIRGRLRALGVRRRLVAPARPTNGWGSLTTSELAVVRLVADGLTNRVVARRLFLSSHTVSMHLRHVFLKLGINSRVELTRLAVDHEHA